MMKLFAFRDRFENEPKEGKAQYHALDIYSIIATTTEGEWNEALALRDQFQRHASVIEAGQIARAYFNQPDQMGSIRLRESRYYRDDFKLTDFTNALLEMFATP